MSRILVVSSYPPRRCGIGAYARDQVLRLEARGERVSVLSPPDGDGDLRSRFPGGWAFLRAARIGGGFDRIVVHFQPALYFRPRRALSKIATALSLVVLAALRGPRLDVLVHEADPPRPLRPDYALLRLAFRLSGRVSFHTRAEWEQLERSYHVRVRGAVVEHRVSPVGDETVSRSEARRRLGVGGSPMFLCAGFIQPSKGFERAVRAFAGSNGARLYVVGSVREPNPENEAYAEALARACREKPGTTFVNRFVEDPEFDLWVRAADWVILPYRRSWSSGVLARAHALGTPALVASIGGLGEQAAQGDLTFGDDGELRSALTAVSAPPTHGTLGGAPPRPEGGASAAPPAPEGGDRHSASDWDPEFQPPLPKKGRRMLFGLILVSVALAATAQLTLKHGMTQVTHRGALPLTFTQPVAAFRRIAVNAAVWGGLITFVVSASVWLLVLSRASLSFAYPFASLSYVIIVAFDQLILHETVSGLRWAGVLLIVGGIVLISRTHQAA